MSGTIARRTCLEQPGEHLVSSMPPEERIVRLQDFSDLTGIKVEHLIFSPYLSTPIPSPQHKTGNTWPGLRADALWHPALWLSPRMLAPRLLGEAGEPMIWDEMMVAIGVELSEGSPFLADGRAWMRMPSTTMPVAPLPEGGALTPPVYDVESGTWLDMAATAGLDTDDPGDIKRIEAWLAGGPDEALDAIDLDAYLVQEGRHHHWATQYVIAEQEGRTWFEDMSDAFDAATYAHLAARAEDFEPQDPTHLRDEITMLTALADTATSYGAAERAPLMAQIEDVEDPYLLSEALDVLRGHLAAMAVELSPGAERFDQRAEEEVAVLTTS